MADIKKTIVINKDILNPKLNKTKKRDKGGVATNIHISPNILRSKFLKRVREHKKIEHKQVNKDFGSSNEIKENLPEEQVQDEFKKSLEFINNFLSREPTNSSSQKTIKHSLIPTNDPLPVFIDLPEEFNIDLDLAKSTLNSSGINKESIQLNTRNIGDEVPYGCLKGGSKPTYRSWNKTIKKSPPINKENDLHRDVVLTKEERIKKLRHKITDTGAKEENVKNDAIKNDAIKNHIKKRTKQTITRRFTLGKSKQGTHIGVLLKDKKTRKKVLQAQKELKKTDMNDIKKYLHTRGLVRIGSTAPSDILRKMYEDTMLAGEISNNQGDILLHNIINSTEL